MKIEEEIKQNRFRSSGQKAFLNIVFTSNWMQSQVKDRLKPYGMTIQQYNVLRILRGRHPKWANPNEIKAVMLDKNPDLTRLCDRMISNGWIVREIDAQNRRKMKISVTQAGLELLEALEPTMAGVQGKFETLSDQENEQLSDLLDKLRG